MGPMQKQAKTQIRPETCWRKRACCSYTPPEPLPACRLPSLERCCHTCFFLSWTMVLFRTDGVRTSPHVGGTCSLTRDIWETTPQKRTHLACLSTPGTPDPCLHRVCSDTRPAFIPCPYGVLWLLRIGRDTLVTPFRPQRGVLLQDGH
jgi:hypothetical protein